MTAMLASIAVTMRAAAAGSVRTITAAVMISAAALTPAAQAHAQNTRASALEPIVYTIRVSAPATHIAEIEARIPTDRRATVDLMLPVWSPGFYGLGNYARNVQEFAARTPDGTSLVVEQPKPNHWVIAANGVPSIVIGYKLLCTSNFVTGSWVGDNFAVINGPSTFITLTEQAKRPHEVHLVLPAVWPRSITSLDPALDGQPNHYRAPDYDVFIDSPIVAGPMSVHEFEVGGARLYLADFGQLGAWDGQAAADKLKPIVEEHRRFLREWPFQRYVFLNGFRGGAGGLEHLNSSLLSSAANTTEPLPTLRWLKYVSHEFFHAINVKRLRPIELGPFDYEKLPATTGLWIAEGLTNYYGELAVVRSGVGPLDDYLAGMSGHIRTLQTSPGRLVQTLEQSSLNAGAQGSGVGGNRNSTISYYDKGAIVGLLLDARIRRVTNDAKSLDDVMRLAYRRYSGERGFRAEEFVATASEITGSNLADFMHRMLATTEELNYEEALDWFGLRFAEPGSADAARAWLLEPRPDATAAQKQHLQRLVAPSR
jgi:predicted metalloprotease with PDZ domain